MSECITTTECYIIDDIPEFESKCPVCMKVTKQRATWVSVLCLSCRGEHGPDYTYGMIASQRRRIILGMSRKELGQKLGLKTSTIRRYESDPCPMTYFNKLGAFLQKSQRCDICQRRLYYRETPNKLVCINDKCNNYYLTLE